MLFKELYSNFCKAAFLFLFAFVSLNPSLIAQTVENDEKKQPDSEKTSEPPYIPIHELNNEIQNFYLNKSKWQKELIESNKLDSLTNNLNSHIDSLNVLLSDSLYLDFVNQNIRTLKYKERFWKWSLDELENFNNDINNYFDKLIRVEKDVQRYSFVWKNTYDSIKTKAYKNISKIMGDRVKTILDSIPIYSLKIENEKAALLLMQDKTTHIQYEIQKLLDNILAVKKKSKSRIFTIDYEPIWSSIDSDSTHINFFDSFIKVFNSEKKSIDFFLQENAVAVNFHIAILLFVLFFFLYLYRRYKDKDIALPENAENIEFKYFILKPIASSFFISAFAAFFIYSQRTSFINGIFIFIVLIIIIWLLINFVSRTIILYFAALVVLFVFYLFASFIDNDILVQRWIFLILNIIILAAIAFIIKPKSNFYSQKNGLFLKTLLRSLPIFFILLLFALVANIIGAVSFAILITAGFIQLAAVTIIIFTALFLISSISIVILDNRLKQHEELQDTYGPNLSVSIMNIFRFGAIVIWLIAATRIFGLHDYIYSWYEQAITFSISSGETEIQLGAILVFFFILLISFVGARLIRMFLDFEVFSRVKLPRGIPGAISMIVRYSIVFVGIYLAISSLGVDLSSFGLLAGAMGVGLGFGLQNIISNFVSGIILAFERPVQVGDTVEVNTVFGKVKSIGVRSSIVKTFDGSEVVLPNNELISKQLTNWTLMDKKRRAKLNIKVAFGQNPHQIIEIVNNVIKSHNKVLTEPEPFIAFQGFGDNFLEFTTYYWLQSEFLVTKSEIALKIHDALIAQGIKMPKPQGEFNINLTDSTPDGNNINNKQIKSVPKDDDEELDLDSI